MANAKWWRVSVLSLSCLFAAGVALGMSDDGNVSDIEDDVEYEQRAMIRAVRAGDRDALDDLLLSGADSNMFDGDDPVIMAALRRGYWPVVRRLLEDRPMGARADLTIAERGGRGMRPLHLAIMRAESEDDVELAAELMDRRSVNCSDANGSAPLHYAVTQPNEEVGSRLVDTLMKKGAYSSMRDYLRRTPLILASEYGNVSVVRQLIVTMRQNRQNNFSAVDSRGHTALSIAQAKGRQRVADLLCEEEKAGRVPKRRGSKDSCAGKRVRFDGTQTTLDGWLERLGQ